MKKNLELTKQILERFIESDATIIYFENLDDRPAREFIRDEEFLHALLLIFEGGLVTNEELDNYPITKLGLHPLRVGYDYSNVKLRLSEKGHEFLKALETPEVFDSIKSHAQSMTATAICSLGSQLLERFVKSQLGLPH